MTDSTLRDLVMRISDDVGRLREQVASLDARMSSIQRARAQWPVWISSLAAWAAVAVSIIWR